MLAAPLSAVQWDKHQVDTLAVMVVVLIISTKNISPPDVTSGGVDITLLLQNIQPFLNCIFVWKEQNTHV
jgi:hypothetical protein